MAARLKLSMRYSWMGAVLGLGAPLGFALLRRLLGRARAPLRRELADQRVEYSYMTATTPLVFALFGHTIGQHEDELRAAHAETARLRDEFAAVVAHDLRNPIQAISLQLQLLLRDAQDGVVRVPADTLRRLQRSTVRLEQMTADLLDASRIEASRLRIAPERLNLSDAVSSVLDQIRPTVGEHAVTLKVDGTPPPVSVDPNRLAQILTNLVVNAAKYGAERAPIVVRIRPARGGAAISVEDEGPGIPSSELPRLFDRFYQAKRARQFKSGLGLGLYITKGLVEAHGGQIAVTSELGRGSVFTVWLPAA
jgi:signal transduction histidine kinase